MIDIGVASGTPTLYDAFPNSFFFLIEPLKEFEPKINQIVSHYNGEAIYAAANSTDGEISINVHLDHLEDSSLLNEEMGDEFDGIQRSVPSVKLDTLLENRKLKPPYLLKIDAQGAETDILAGSVEALKLTEVVILETSMFGFMKSCPQFYDIIYLMKNKGFVVYDIFSGHTRPLDGTLGQVDMVFVKENGKFRKSHSYATPEQWNEIVSK